MNEQEVITLYDLTKWVLDWMHTCEINHVDPKDVPFYIENKNRRYRPFSGSLGFGNKGVSVRIEYFDSDIVRFDPKDKRPEGGGEYWKSRGASSYDVSGFVESKPAGERLLRMVKYVLETDEPKTWLDYREFEPIPLTSELLEKNGFERVPQPGCANPYHWMMEKYEEESDGLLYRIKAFNNPFRGMFVSIDNPSACETMSFGKQIEFVHEFQHALRICEIELEIKLDD